MKIVYPIRIKYSMHGYIAYCETMGISAYGPSIDLVIKRITKNIKKRYMIDNLNGDTFHLPSYSLSATLMDEGFHSSIIINTEEL